MNRKLNKPAKSREEHKTALRKCIVTGEVLPKDDLFRFVVSPDGMLVFDHQKSLPGRGIWIRRPKKYIELAIRKGLFSRSAKQKIVIPESILEAIDKALLEKCLNLLGLCRKRGLLKTGFAKVEAALKSNKAAVLIAASDGAVDGRQKLSRLAHSLKLVELFSGEELSQAVGLENAVHIAITPDGLTDKFLIEVSRLQEFRDVDNVS
ncbi:RNA-binding protein [Sneathiella glossodoripedis]|uniref:RNA-binding protein n=1 Tax=Sneathiella glossodoripedis TaxID=418853 RepID=UPI00046E93FF|nr:RNA-binding protein [Sneathiella glossodoripedis]